ncbi:Demethylrebeccamycin-D-glucose O-methyltransferase [bacterium HR40]|nr:Demethylrebeccamycin-D-glucose O-methyltransferase [bacterium HR40]
MTRPSGDPDHRPFDRRLLRLRRERWLAAADAPLFLHEEMAERLVERLGDIRRNFATVLELGCGRGALSRRLAARSDLRTLVRTDLARAAAPGPGHFVQADEEALPFGAETFDAVVSVGAFHWVCDLPGVLVQLRRILRPDGLLLVAFPGGDTLFELRRSLLLAELELCGGAVPRVAPFVQLADAAALLQRAGFALPVADIDRLTVRYRDPQELLGDLRRMGESGAPRLAGGAPLRRDVLARALAIYRRDFAARDGRVPATFEIIWMTGWSPHPDQPQPKPRGSGKVDLGDWLGRGSG